jgi:hypothetical protein
VPNAPYGRVEVPKVPAGKLELCPVVPLSVADDVAAPEFCSVELVDPETEGMIELVDVELEDAAAPFDAEVETTDVSRVLDLVEAAALDDPAIFVPEV